jgi:hypothetical protein
VIGNPNLTQPRQDAAAWALTVAGMADKAMPGSPHRCGGCMHWLRDHGSWGEGRCAEYQHRMRGRRGRRGAKIKATQVACKLWVPA